MKKVLLFNPRATTYARIIPNSILQIAASIEGRFDYTIVDGNREKDPWPAIDRFMTVYPDAFFCSTVMPGPQLRQAVPFSKRIKENYPHATVIWGGYFASNHAETVARSGFVDFVVAGPGDLAFPNLLHALSHGQPVSPIGNLVYPDNGTVRRTSKDEIPDQDKLPPLPYDSLTRFYSMDGYLMKTFLGSRTLSYHSSIGCPFTCSFCGVVPIYSARWKAKSAARVYADIKMLKDRWGANAITFHDNNFFVSEKRAVEFARLIRPENMPWWAEGRIDTMNKYADDSFSLIRESGCRMIFFGAESGNNTMLKRMDKGGTQSAEQILSFAERIRQFDIIPEYSFILGFPAPTEEEVWRMIEADMEFIRLVKRINPATEIIIYVYSPVPTTDSDLYAQVQTEGFEYPRTLEEWLQPRWQDFDLHREFITPWLTPAMIRRIHEFETVLHSHYPTISDYKITPFQRKFMKRLSKFRYRRNFLSHPWELKILQRYWLRYRRPEKEGF
jgi:radical SAM superfamily enzyme YgiQ (UPF0313 family)